MTVLEHPFIHQLDHDTCQVRAIYSPDTWIEGSALEQLKTMATLPGMKLAVGLPDLHPGKGCPIGAAFWSEHRFYPFLIGNDIGCGMALWQTDSPVRKAKVSKWIKKLDLEQGIPSPKSEQSPKLPDLGTVGGGNHFAELQQVESVQDPELFAQAGLKADAFQLLVHSGSRGLGEQILRAHTAIYGNEGLDSQSEAAAVYLKEHDAAVAWAHRNREVVKDRFLKAMGHPEHALILDVCHNALTPQEYKGKQGWLHRKGAAPTDKGLIVIPGSRGDYSYLVKPLAGAESGWSLAHGAGRKWKRSESKGRLDRKFKPEQLQKTDLGSQVICEHKGLLYEEAPQAYKSVDDVVNTLIEVGLVAPVARLKPVITYKTRRSKR